MEWKGTKSDRFVLVRLTLRDGDSEYGSHVIFSRDFWKKASHLEVLEEEFGGIGECLRHGRSCSNVNCMYWLTDRDGAAQIDGVEYMTDGDYNSVKKFGLAYLLAAESFESTPYSNYYGACLTPDGGCFETTMENCRTLNGRFQGPGTSCGGYQPPLMAAEESIDKEDLCSSGIHDIGITSCGHCFDDICLACHPEEIDHSATEKGDGWVMQFCNDCADYIRKLNTSCDCMIDVPAYVKPRCQECTSCFGCQAKIYEMGDYGSICVDCANKGVIDGTWNTEQFNSQNQTNNSGKGLWLAITVGVMTGVASAVFGNVISEMWLDRLREDPELNTTPEEGDPV